MFTSSGEMEVAGVSVMFTADSVKSEVFAVHRVILDANA
jgi:hypothetical protein